MRSSSHEDYNATSGNTQWFPGTSVPGISPVIQPWLLVHYLVFFCITALSVQAVHVFDPVRPVQAAVPLAFNQLLPPHPSLCQALFMSECSSAQTAAGPFPDGCCSLFCTPSRQMHTLTDKRLDYSLMNMITPDIIYVLFVSYSPAKD